MRLRYKFWLGLGGTLSVVIALLHIVVIFAGGRAYRYFGAGEGLAELADEGSIRPALLTLLLAAIFALFGWYGFSGAGLVRRLPFLRPVLVLVAGVYTLRGIALLPQVVRIADSPASIAPREIVFSLASLLVGFAYSAGTVSNWKRLNASGPTAPAD